MKTVLEITPGPLMRSFEQLGLRLIYGGSVALIVLDVHMFNLCSGLLLKGVKPKFGVINLLAKLHSPGNLTASRLSHSHRFLLNIRQKLYRLMTFPEWLVLKS